MSGATGERPFSDILTSIRYWGNSQYYYSFFIYCRLAFCKYWSLHMTYLVVRDLTNILLKIGKKLHLLLIVLTH